MKELRNKTIKSYNISEIEAMTEKEAQAIALFKKEIKGYNVYFINFNGYFKFSYVVYKNNRPIYHANDYQLHHDHSIYNDYNLQYYKQPIYNYSQLYKYYLNKLNRVLLTDEECVKKYETYDEYERVKNYLHNIYVMQFENISMFKYCKNEAEERAYKEATKNMLFNEIGFCYMNDKEAIEKQRNLYKTMLKNKNQLSDNYQYLYDAFKNEMFNHEYAINTYQGNYDVLSSLYNVKFNENDDINEYFKQLHFTDTQKRAYIDAANYVIRNSNGW